jgi:hypothetical protein
MRGLKPGRADDMQDAGIGGELGKGDRRVRRREIEHAIGGCESCGGVARHLDAGCRQAGENPGILAERGRARPLDRGHKRAAVGLIDGANEHPAHPPGGTDDDETHITHGRQAPGWLSSPVLQ